MKRNVLHTGQTDFKLVVKIDYEDGSQITEGELENAQALEILYAYKDYDGTNVAEDSWTADGYYIQDNAPYIYYDFKGVDIIPDEVDTMVGRAKITDEDGLISYGRQFTIQVMASEL